MKNSINLIFFGFLITLIYVYSKSNTQEGIFLKKNEHVNNSLQLDIDWNDSLAIFRTVFSNLPDEVDVLPTENYYYFEVAIGGKQIKGNIALFANSRDDGIVNFGYDEMGSFQDPVFGYLNGEMDLSADLGVQVMKKDDFTYAISFEGKAVVFHLNDIGMDGRITTQLAEHEIFLGTSFDESGLPFDLLYDSLFQNIFYVLNEDQIPVEDWYPLTDQILVGKRTGFAVYIDSINDRKVLFGVNAKNEYVNNWYDGPFDQLPDNMIYSGRLNLKPYIEYYNPSTIGLIDNYGNYLSDMYTRVAITSYLSYQSLSDLISVYDMSRDASDNLQELTFQLTQPREIITNTSA